MSRYCLGFDTSCYTTSVACAGRDGVVVDERKVLDVPHGGRGLRQSDALFQHNRNLPPLLDALFSHIDRRLVRAVAVSVSPTAAPDSYMPVFLAGQLAARSVAGALDVPLMVTNHQAGHLRAALLGNEALLLSDCFLALHLSGGTTDLLLVRPAAGGLGEATPLGASSDLHAGQLVDRVGVAMGLPFPCGARFEALARRAQERLIRIPSSVRALNCSFSGAEAQAFRLLRDGTPPEEVAYAIYDFLARTLSRILLSAAQETGCKDALAAGGVASSALLRELLASRLQGRVRLSFGESALSSDNAVGTALLASDAWGGELL